ARRPQVSTHAATMASTSADSDTSAWTATASPPAPSTMPTVSAAPSSLTSTTAMRAPLRANSTDAARPCPDAAPVTSATFPSSTHVTLALATGNDLDMRDDPVIGQLTGPGGPFEIVPEDVRGVVLDVYKSRLHSMRDLIAMAEGRGDADFVVQGDRRLTYAAHNASVRTLAAALVGEGVGRGDRVALLSANNPEWVCTFWACAAASVVCVPLNAWWKAEEL